jgi:hypothetical protein
VRLENIKDYMGETPEESKMGDQKFSFIFISVFGTICAVMWLAKRNPSAWWTQLLFRPHEGLNLNIKGRLLASVRNNGLAFMLLAVLHFAFYFFAFWYVHPFDGGEYELLTGIICILPAWLGLVCLGGGLYLMSAWLILTILGMMKRSRGAGDG